jgi:hypothetical protein
MRKPSTKVTGGERHGGGPLLKDGGWQRLDPSWRSEEAGPRCKTEGKSTVSSRGFSEWKESMSDGLELRLISDEQWRR